jgi:hypothetical protein
LNDFWAKYAAFFLLQSAMREECGKEAFLMRLFDYEPFCCEICPISSKMREKCVKNA